MFIGEDQFKVRCFKCKKEYDFTANPHFIDARKSSFTDVMCSNPQCNYVFQVEVDIRMEVRYSYRDKCDVDKTPLLLEW